MKKTQQKQYNDNPNALMNWPVKKPRKLFGSLFKGLKGGIRVRRTVTRTTEFIIDKPDG